MNKANILRASKAFLRLENAQNSFNAAIDLLTDEEIIFWAKEIGVTIKPSETKLRIAKIIKVKGCVQ